MTAQSVVRATRVPVYQRDQIHLVGTGPEQDWLAGLSDPGDLAAWSPLAPSGPPTDPRRLPLDLEIVVPVYNEAPHIVERISELRRFLNESFPFRAVVTVVDNASTDDTYALAAQLATVTQGVAVMHLPRKGRGLALRSAWSTSTAPVVAYMDVDLSTSLSALLPLVAPLISGHGDVAIGSRLARGAHVVRGPSANSFLVPTTCSSGCACAVASAMPSVVSRPSGPMWPVSSFHWSKTTSGSLTLSCW